MIIEKWLKPQQTQPVTIKCFSRKETSISTGWLNKVSLILSKGIGWVLQLTVICAKANQLIFNTEIWVYLVSKGLYYKKARKLSRQCWKLILNIYLWFSNYYISWNLHFLHCHNSPEKLKWKYQEKHTKLLSDFGHRVTVVITPNSSQSCKQATLILCMNLEM